jgi:hypothetical protein
MITQRSILEAYNALSTDPQLLRLLGFNRADGTPRLDAKLLEERITKTRQSGIVAGDYMRLGIWEDKPEPINRKANQHILYIDVVVPLVRHQATGIALELAGRIKPVLLLQRKKFGTGLRYETTIPDLVIGQGWYKCAVKFTYNRVGK